MMARDRVVTIFPLPPQLPTNPYLDQLYGAMAGQTGVEVRRDRPRYALLALLFGRGPRILHLHFFDELTQRPWYLMTALRSLLFLAMLALLRLRGVRIVWTAHNLEPHELYHPEWGVLVYRLVARWADAIIAHSQAAREMLEARYGPLPQCVVIPQGNYVGLYGPRRERYASRVALDLPAEGPVLLCLGALRPYKNIEGLIDAFAELPEATRGTLLIAGSAKSPDYAVELLAHARRVPGTRVRTAFVPDADLPAYFAAADLVVLPYRKLLTSAMLLCALSYARPVVAPGFGPVRELLHDEQAGFVFAPGDDEALHAALERALAHGDFDTLGEAGLALARTFDWQSIAAVTAECYRRVSASTRN
ncbi:MAG TPA: glycosyltransferase family 4 protein [Roseiflexaceae bacterium]|nr:glycosyltransferase family 4 protein [Roseiflexaceae bacterium]